MIDLNTILSELNEEDTQKTPPAICYYPGGFKPPHEGHFEVLKDLASRPYVTKVIVLIGHKTRDGITKEQSKRIWDLYLATSPMAKAVVRISTDASPIKDIFTAFNDDLELKAYVAGAKNEVEEQDYFTPLQKAFSTRVMPLAIEEKVVTNNKRLSGTQVRELVTKLKQSVLNLRSVSDKSSIEYSKAKNEYLNNYKELEGCFPEVIIQKGQYDDILKILGIPVLNIDQLQEGQEDSNLVIRIPYTLTTKIENYLNTMLIPFEYSQQAFGGKERRMLIPNLSDNPEQRENVLNWLSKKGIAVNIEEDLFTINWWKSTLEETLTEPQDKTDNIIADFIDFVSQALDLQQVPKITFSDDENLAKQMHALGAYQPKTDELLVVKGSRLTADILRTLAHELVHRKQAEIGPLSAEDGKTGSEAENEANAAAGVLLRQFGQYRPEIFEEADASKGDYKIYCDMDGVIVDFDKGYKELTGRDASFDIPKEEFWAPISKAGAPFWIKLKWMPDGKQLWDYIKEYNPELLSAPSREESSKMGKRIWVKRELPGTKLILRQAERKQEFATPNSILIDDRADNIQRWKNAGGIGIVHTSAADTIQQLKDLGL
jgi:nicotinamide mononucleotide adenylyltransferase/lambda repressor-like predicted transcriptional regulator